MAQLFANNATSTLAAGITDTATSLTVGTGAGAEFPNPTAPDYFLVTLESATDVEIVKVTARSGDVMTLVRAQEGTVAAAFATDDLVELRVTAATMTNAMVAPAQIYAGAMREIASVTTTGSQSTVTFSAIPSTYRDLVAHVSARGTASAGSVEVYARFNGDTAANYWWLVENRFGNGSNAASTSFRVNNIPAATALSNAQGFHRVTVPNYTATFRKQAFAESGFVDGAAISNTLSMISTGWWDNTGPITQIQFLLSSGAFLDGSVITLYGIGGEVGGAALNPIYTKYDPFCPPASPSTLDDEFNVDGSGTPSGWTLVGTTPDTTLVRKGQLRVLSPLSAGFASQLYEKTLPAGAFTVVTKVDLVGLYRYENSGVYVRNSTSGKRASIGFFRDAASDTALSDSYLLAWSKWSATDTRASITSMSVYERTLFLMLSYDGTTLLYRWSRDGIHWTTFLSEAIGTHFTSGELPNRVGLYALSENNTNKCDRVFEFFRYFPVATEDIGRNIGVGSDGSVVESLPLILHNQVI